MKEERAKKRKRKLRSQHAAATTKTRYPRESCDDQIEEDDGEGGSRPNRAESCSTGRPPTKWSSRDSGIVKRPCISERYLRRLEIIHKIMKLNKSAVSDKKVESFRSG